MAKSLWGEEFNISTKDDTSALVQRLADPVVQVSLKRKLSSKTTRLEDKLGMIESGVMSILGRYRDNTLIIKSKEELHDYISTAISNGIIAIDTETNNSLDPLTCKIMGACIYTPGLKQAYIPMNHIDRFIKGKYGYVEKSRGSRYAWQITEQELKEEFDRLGNTKIIMHNAKFDYEVIKCTCDCKLSVYWDTMLGAKLLDENERAGLKQQYIEKIDPSVEKYSIEELFSSIEYAIVDPDLFALYAATDAMMTYKLYEYQLGILSKPENKKLLSLLLNIEMPVMEVAAEMELTGVCIDTEYAKRLSKKYNKTLAELDERISEEVDKYSNKIAEWRKTKEAQERAEQGFKKTIGGKTYRYHDASGGPGDTPYWVEDKTSKQVSLKEEYALGLPGKKSKSDQLETPVNLASPQQLAILLYDVLKVPVVDKKSPRGTGEEILKEIDIPLSKLILERRGLLKLINTYIDTLPQQTSPRDGRLHASFNQAGTATGRFSSSEPNL